MANDRKPASKDAEKRYAVLHTIILGKGETREERKTGFVTAGEVGGEDVVRQLLAAGIVSDLDAPVRPSEASEARARAFAIDVALQGGVITREGERYTFGGRTFNSDTISEIPLAELGASIIGAMKA